MNAATAASATGYAPLTVITETLVASLFEARAHNVRLVPQSPKAASSLLRQGVAAIDALRQIREELPANTYKYVENRYPNDYTEPSSNSLYLREQFNIPERKDSAARIVRHALVALGYVRVFNRKGEPISRTEALATWWDSARAGDGYLIELVSAK